jgi:hypothetical protein
MAIIEANIVSPMRVASTHCINDFAVDPLSEIDDTITATWHCTWTSLSFLIPEGCELIINWRPYDIPVTPVAEPEILRFTAGVGGASGYREMRLPLEAVGGTIIVRTTGGSGIKTVSCTFTPPR